jgi:hypothetical protein
MVVSLKGLGPELDCAGRGQQHVHMTDSSSRQRGCPHKKQDRNCQTVINIWSWAPDGARHQDLFTYWPSVAMWLRLEILRCTACFTCSPAEVSITFSPYYSAPPRAKWKFHFNAALPMLISKLFLTIRSKAPVQLLSSVRNEVHILILYLFHFLELYPFLIIPLPEGRTDTSPPPLSTVFKTLRKCLGRVCLWLVLQIALIEQFHVPKLIMSTTSL